MTLMAATIATASAAIQSVAAAATAAFGGATARPPGPVEDRREGVRAIEPVHDQKERTKPSNKRNAGDPGG